MTDPAPELREGASPAPAGTWQLEMDLGPYAPEEAARILRALQPESGEGVPRTHVEVFAGSVRSVRLRIRAPTTGSLRAAANAHLRWVELARQVDELAGRARAAGPRPG